METRRSGVQEQDTCDTRRTPSLSATMHSAAGRKRLSVAPLVCTRTAAPESRDTRTASSPHQTREEGGLANWREHSLLESAQCY